MSAADRVSVRAQRPDDRAVVRDVVTAAFGGSLEADLAEALHDSAAGAHGLSLVAELDGSVVGHVQLTRGWVDAAERLVEVQVLSPLSVVPARQRQGVGTRLVAEALAAADLLGVPLVFLEGAPDYYLRLGFKPAGDLGFSAPSVRIPAAAFQVFTLAAWEPWMTGALVYPEVFWALDCVGLRPG